MGERIGIGHGVTIQWLTVDGNRVGLELSHVHGDGEEHGCYVRLDVPQNVGEPRWNVESWDPLTLSPSILLKTCGLHGFIRNGRWVPA